MAINNAPVCTPPPKAIIPPDVRTATSGQDPRSLALLPLPHQEQTQRSSFPRLPRPPSLQHSGFLIISSLCLHLDGVTALGQIMLPRRGSHPQVWSGLPTASVGRVNVYNPRYTRWYLTSACTWSTATAARRLRDRSTHTRAKCCVYADIHMFTSSYKCHLHIVLYCVLFHVMTYLESLILYIHSLFLEGYLWANNVLPVGRVIGDKTCCIGFSIF